PNALIFLSLKGPRFSNADTQFLEKCSRLETLILHKTRISDSGMSRICKLSKLSDLRLANSKVTAIGLQNVIKLVHLEELQCRCSQLDSACSCLRGLHKLELLILLGHPSPKKLQALKRVLPTECVVK